MRILFENIDAAFSSWKPCHGRVFNTRYAFDCETTPIDENRPWLTPAYVLGAAYDGRRGVYVTREHLSAFFQAHRQLPIGMHYAVFDLRVIDVLAPELDIYSWVDRNLVWDSWLLHRLLVLGTEGHTASGKGQSTLERCVKKYLGIELPKDLVDQDGDAVRLSYGKWLNRPPETMYPIYLEYLGKDVLATFSLLDVLHHQICSLLDSSRNTFGYVSQAWMSECASRWGLLTHHIQLKGAIVLDRITENGICIDKDRRDESLCQLDETANEIKERLRSYGYLPGQTGSGKALQEIMRRLDRENPDVAFPRTKTGKYATKREVIQDLADVEPFIKDYLEFKAVDKLRSSFLNKMGRQRLHPSFSPLQVSGRTSSFGEINAQNLPRDDRVRSCFVPSPGHIFISADYSTVEMATLAQVVLGQLQIPSRMACEINNGKDLHRLVAAYVTSKPEEEVTDEERQKTKPINFGKPGGMGDAGLKRYAKSSYGVELTDDEVSQLTDSWFALFPEMQTFLDYDTDLGEEVARFFDLTPARFQEITGSTKYSDYCRSYSEQHQPSSFLGWMCLKTIKQLNPTTNKGRPYSADEIEFFWGQLNSKAHLFPQKWFSDIEHRRPSFELWKITRWLVDRVPCFTLTGRLRAAASFCARRNTLFQGLAADGAKLGLWLLWRAGYRIGNFIHDENLVEIPINSDWMAHGQRIKELMIQGMRQVVPDIRIDVEFAATDRWFKGAKHVVDSTGKLCLWRPEIPVEAESNLVGL